ncbi:MAG: stage III sporulation protein AE [Clostridia bacterium]|nr:stage III sporulation protein AE [Clostridia bacterium]
MKKYLIVLFLVIVSFIINLNVVLVEAKGNNYDQTISEILNGIDESLYLEFNDVLNEFFNDNSSFKERIIKFLTGELHVDIASVKQLIFNRVNQYVKEFLKVVCLILFIGISCTVLNGILSKNNDNIENNTIFFIFYILVVSIAGNLISKFVISANDVIKNLSKTTELIFPLLFSVSSLCGNLGVSVYKPLTAFISYFSSVITSNYLLPIIVFGGVSLIVGNLSQNVKISGLSKTVFSLFKWILGIIVIVYTVILSIQGIVNASYNGISIKILKYATGSIVPIVGGFLSGGVDVLLSSAILIKNSIGLLSVIYLLIAILGKGIAFISTSFLLKFGASICEPIIDKRFYNLLIGIGDVINYLASLIFLSGFMYFITIIGFIFSTISVF